MARTSIIFVCVGNTCRSLMAEFIARDRFVDMIEPSSAGFQPQAPEDAENAIYTLRSLLNIDASSHQPRGIHDVDLTHFDHVVTMDKWVADRFAQDFPSYPAERVIKWKVHDPYGDDLEEYRKCAQTIFRELKALVTTDRT